MEKKDLSETDKLIYFLDDTNEEGYGMYLASAYQNFIKWQNEFLNHIIKNDSKKEIFKCYLENLKKEIPIYDANPNQILSISSCFGNFFDDLDDLINTYSRRKIFNKDGTINYSQYNKYEFDIPSIEEELAKGILPGKCLFEEDNYYFVTFWGEGFNGGKSNIFHNFNKKYQQSNLDNKEKDIIVEFLRRHPNRNEFKLFFSSMQLIIFYLMNNDFDENDTISNIITKAPKYLKIDRSQSIFLIY